MKKLRISSILVLIVFVLSITVNAQIKGNGNITKQLHETASFNSVKIDGAGTLILTQSDNFTVEVETDSNIQDHVTIEVKNNTLYFGFDTKKIKKYKTLKFHVSAPYFKHILVSGASDVVGTDVLSGDNLYLTVSGASDVSLNVDYNNVSTNISGASDVTITGSATSSVVESSGASDFDGKQLITNSSVVEASGASTCFVNAKTSLVYEVSGASDVKYVSNPETVIITKGRRSSNMVVTTKSQNMTNHYSHVDTTNVSVGNLKVTVVDGDTTQVSVGRHTLIVTDDGNVSWKRCKRTHFNGHWGGFELGINGYVTPDFNTNWDSEYNYLNLQYEKSIAVNLNLYEQNISLNKNKTIGLITGLGFTWNNYRFSNDTYLTTSDSEIKGYYMEGVSVRKTKLTAMYLTVPLIFEMQTNHLRNINRFHFGVGVVAQVRISTHTKVYFNDANKTYQLRDPKTNELLPNSYSTPNSSHRNIVKNFNSFYLQPFKFDATARFGYGIINLFVTYSLNQMFENDRGLELYPISAGITLVGW